KNVKFIIRRKSKTPWTKTPGASVSEIDIKNIQRVANKVDAHIDKFNIELEKRNNLTSALIILNGMKALCSPYILLPITLREYCTGIFRSAFSRKTIPAAIATAITNNNVPTTGSKYPS